MRSIIKATALLSSTSVVTILIGLVSAKLYAIYLGPTGHGTMGLLQSLVGLSALVAGFGVGTGVVRRGARYLELGELVKVAALKRAAWLLVWGFGLLTVLLMVLFRDALAGAMLNDPSKGWDVVLMGVALLFMLVGALQIKMLNAHHKVGSLARYGVFNALFGSSASVAIVVVWGFAGIPYAVIAGCMVSWLVSLVLLRRAVEPLEVGPSWAQTREAGRDLLVFGGPFMISSLFGPGVGMLLPILVSQALGNESLGYYRAAMAISVSYLGFILTAMAQDYYPRVSAAEDGDLERLVDQQHRLIMLLAQPMILGVLALAPWAIRIVYSAEFLPGTAVLEWQLIGDFFKFSSWTLSIVILARTSSLTYFGLEAVGGVTMVGGSWLAMQLFGLPGLGIGFLVSYAIYFSFAAWLVRRRFGFTFKLQSYIELAVAVSLAVAVQAMPALGLGQFRLPLALSLAVLFGVRSLIQLYAMWKEPTPTAPAPRNLGESEAARGAEG